MWVSAPLKSWNISGTFKAGHLCCPWLWKIFGHLFFDYFFFSGPPRLIFELLAFLSHSVSSLFYSAYGRFPRHYLSSYLLFCVLPISFLILKNSFLFPIVPFLRFWFSFMDSISSPLSQKMLTEVFSLPYFLFLLCSMNWLYFLGDLFVSVFPHLVCLFSLLFTLEAFPKCLSFSWSLIFKNESLKTDLACWQALLGWIRQGAIPIIIGCYFALSPELFNNSK